MPRIMNKFIDKVCNIQDKSFMQAFTLKLGINKFGDKGIHAATDEFRQLHESQVFKPIYVDNLTNAEKQRAMESVIVELAETTEFQWMVCSMFKILMRRSQLEQQQNGGNKGWKS
jgi:hypothetical protein